MKKLILCSLLLATPAAAQTGNPPALPMTLEQAVAQIAADKSTIAALGAALNKAIAQRDAALSDALNTTADAAASAQRAAAASPPSH